MAKIIVSTNNVLIEKLIDKNVKSGFKNYKKLNCDEFTLVVFEKKINPVDNFFQADGDGFIATAGTLFYNDSIGTDALKKAYNDFDGDVRKIQSNLIGNFLVVILKFGKLYFFTDTYQVIKSYYSIVENDWLVSNSLDDVALLNTNIEMDVDELIIESLMVSSIGENTMIKNVKKLMGYQCLQFTLGDLKVIDIGFEKMKFDLDALSIDEIALKYSDMAKKYFKVIAKNFPQHVGIHQTGGLDNRTVLAGFLNENVKPLLMYGVGDSALTNTKDNDLEICKQYKSNLNLDLYIMDWKDGADKNNTRLKKMFQQQGFYYSIYGGSEGFINSYELNRPSYPKFMECGYFLENLRMREFAEEMEGSLTLEQFIDQYLLSGSYGINKNSKIKDLKTVRKILIETFRKQIGIYNIDVKDGITKENFDEIRWIHARHTDSLMVNFLNQYTCSMAIFSQQDLHDFPFSIKADHKIKAKFQLKVIEKTHNKLLDFPFFSHCRLHKFDTSTFQLISLSDKNIIEKFKKRLKRILSDESIYKLQKIKSLLESNVKKEPLIKTVSDIFDGSDIAKGIFFDQDIDFNNIVYLTILAQNIKAIDFIKEY